MPEHLLTTWETWHGAPIQLYLLDGDDVTTWQQWHGEPLTMGVPEQSSGATTYARGGQSLSGSVVAGVRQLSSARAGQALAGAVAQGLGQTNYSRGGSASAGAVVTGVRILAVAREGSTTAGSVAQGQGALSVTASANVQSTGAGSHQANSAAQRASAGVTRGAGGVLVSSSMANVAGARVTTSGQVLSVTFKTATISVSTASSGGSQSGLSPSHVLSAAASLGGKVASAADSARTSGAATRTSGAAISIAFAASGSVFLIVTRGAPRSFSAVVKQTVGSVSSGSVPRHLASASSQRTGNGRWSQAAASAGTSAKGIIGLVQARTGPGTRATVSRGIVVGIVAALAGRTFSDSSGNRIAFTRAGLGGTFDVFVLRTTEGSSDARAAGSVVSIATLARPFDVVTRGSGRMVADITSGHTANAKTTSGATSVSQSIASIIVLLQGVLRGTSLFSGALVVQPGIQYAECSDPTLPPPPSVAVRELPEQHPVLVTLLASDGTTLCQRRSILISPGIHSVALDGLPTSYPITILWHGAATWRDTVFVPPAAPLPGVVTVHGVERWPTRYPNRTPFTLYCGAQRLRVEPDATGAWSITLPPGSVVRRVDQGALQLPSDAVAIPWDDLTSYDPETLAVDMFGMPR